MKPPCPVRLTLTPLASDREQAQRLKQILKYCLRAQEHRCTLVEWLDDDERTEHGDRQPTFDP